MRGWVSDFHREWSERRAERPKGVRAVLVQLLPASEASTAKGAYETLVTDGPHMDRRIKIEYEKVWDAGRGTLRITNAWIE